MTTATEPGRPVILGDNPLEDLQLAVDRDEFAFATVNDAGSEYMVITDQGVLTLGRGHHEPDGVLDLGEDYLAPERIQHFHDELVTIAILVAAMGFKKEFVYGTQWPADARKFTWGR